MRRMGRHRRAYSNAGSGGGGGDFLPTDIPGLVLWLRSDLGITAVMSAVASAGTSPPVVTLTGTPSPLLPVEIDITLPGLRGVAMFQWKLGGIVQQTGLVTGASVALGSGTLAAQFTGGASAYLGDNVYTATVQVSAWADQSGIGNSVTQGVLASSPGYSLSGAPNALPSLTFASQFMTGPAAPFTVASTWTLLLITKPNNASASGCLYSCGASAGVGLSLFQGTVTASRREINFNGVNTDEATGTATSTNWEKWVITNSASPAQTMRVGGIPQTVTPGNVSPGGTSASQEIGNRTNGGPIFFNGSHAEIIAYNAALTTTQILSLENYGLARYGV